MIRFLLIARLARGAVKNLDLEQNVNSLSDCIPEGQEFIRLVESERSVSVKMVSISFAPGKFNFFEPGV